MWPETSGPSAGLLRLAERIRLTPGVRPQVDIDESVERLVQEPAVAEHLLAIASEACSNAIRHGHARSVAICLRQERGRVVLTVADDGRGYGRHTRRGPWSREHLPASRIARGPAACHEPCEGRYAGKGRATTARPFLLTG